MRPGFVVVFWILVLGATSIRVDAFEAPAEADVAAAAER